MTAAIVDYGAGNIGSVLRAIRAAGAEPLIVRAPAALRDADCIVVPGVGHFDATRRLTDEWRCAILDRVSRGVPLLGICLGMQWLFDGSDEAPGAPGLGWFRGICRALPAGVKVPHVGWNLLARASRPSRLLDGLPADPAVYFTHSFAAPVVDDTTAFTHYGEPFTAVVERGSVFGVQWHPEKSSGAGRAVLQNFLTLSRASCC